MPSPQKKTIGVGEVTKRRESKNRRLNLLIQTVPIIVHLKNYKNGLPSPYLRNPLRGY